MPTLEFFKNNLLLIGVAFASGAMLLWPYVRRTAGGPWVDNTQATQLINREDALVLDVRDTNEYANGHVLGAKNIPLALLDGRLGEIEKHKDKPIVLVCATGNRSSAAINLLRAKGFTRPCNLSGGYAAWQQAGLPVEKK